MKLKVGDTVRISELGKKRYKDTRLNPWLLEGTIVNLLSGTDYTYQVQWSNEKLNNYREGELEKVDVPLRTVEKVKSLFGHVPKVDA